MTHRIFSCAPPKDSAFCGPPMPQLPPQAAAPLSNPWAHLALPWGSTPRPAHKASHLSIPQDKESLSLLSRLQCWDPRESKGTPHPPPPSLHLWPLLAPRQERPFVLRCTKVGNGGWEGEQGAKRERGPTGLGTWGLEVGSRAERTEGVKG